MISQKIIRKKPLSAKVYTLNGIVKLVYYLPLLLY